MVRYSHYCAVYQCKNNSKNDPSLQWYRVPLCPLTRVRWLSWMGRSDLVNEPEKTIHNKRICSKHFERNMFAGMCRSRLKKNAEPTIFEENCGYKGLARSCLKSDAVPTIIQSHSDSPNKSQLNNTLCAKAASKNVLCASSVTNNENSKNTANCVTVECFEVVIEDKNCGEEIIDLTKEGTYTYNDIEELVCRTCLDVTDKGKYKKITEKCFLNNTVKDVIVLLVPQMVVTLSDDQIVCEACFNFLESCMKFIKKCMDIETTHSVIKKNGNADTFLVIRAEHDYCSKNFSESSPNRKPAKNISKFQSTINDVEYSTNNECDTLPTAEKTSNDVTDVIQDGWYRIKPCSSKSKRKKGPYLKKIYKKREKIFSCATCLETFTSSHDYDAHLKVHPPHMCEKCGKTFPKKETLRAHFVTHNDYTNICEICGKVYKDLGALRAHQKTHITSTELYTCDRCKKTFKTKRLVKCHIWNVHYKTTSCECFICGRLFKKVSTRNSHMSVVHTQMKPYECDTCKKKFGRIDYLRNHISRRGGKCTDIPKSQQERKTRSRTKLRYRFPDDGTKLGRELQPRRRKKCIVPEESAPIQLDT